jgi:hypothetical protein
MSCAECGVTITAETGEVVRDGVTYCWEHQPGGGEYIFATVMFSGNGDRSIAPTHEGDCQYCGRLGVRLLGRSGDWCGCSYIPASFVAGAQHEQDNP